MSYDNDSTTTEQQDSNNLSETKFTDPISALPLREAELADNMAMSRVIQGGSTQGDIQRHLLGITKITLLPSFLNVDLQVTSQYTPSSLLSLAKTIVKYDAIEEIRQLGHNTKLIADLSASVYPTKSTVMTADTKTVSHLLMSNSMSNVLEKYNFTAKLDAVLSFVIEVFSRQLKRMGVLYKHEEWIHVGYKSELIPSSKTLIEEVKIAAVYDVLMKLDSLEALSELTREEKTNGGTREKVKFGALNLTAAVLPIFQQLSVALKDIELYGAYCETAFSIGRKYFSGDAQIYELLPGSVKDSQTFKDLLTDYTFVRCLTESRDFACPFPAIDYQFALQKLHDALYMRKTFITIPISDFREYASIYVAKDGYERPDSVVATLNVKTSGKTSLVKFFPVSSTTERGGRTSDMLSQVKYGSYSDRASAFSVPIFEKLNTAVAASHIRMLLEYKDVEPYEPGEEHLSLDSHYIQGVIIDEASISALAIATPGVQVSMNVTSDDLIYSFEYTTTNLHGRYVTKALQEGKMIITPDAAEVLLVNRDHEGSKFFVSSDRLVEEMDQKIIVTEQQKISLPLQLRKLKFSLGAGIGLPYAIKSVGESPSEMIPLTTHITLQRLLGIPDGLALEVIYVPAATAILSRTVSAFLTLAEKLGQETSDPRLIQKAVGMVLYQLFAPSIDAATSRDAVRALQIAMLEEQKDREGKELLRSQLKIRKNQGVMKTWVTLSVLQRLGLITWKTRGLIDNYFNSTGIQDDIALSGGLI